MSGPDAMRPLSCDEVRELAGAFVLGALDAADEAAVRAHLDGHVDAHPEIAELGSVIPAFLETVPVVEPPDTLKARIMAAAAADLAARGGPAPQQPAPERPAPEQPAPSAPPAPLAFPSVEERLARRARTSVGTWVLRIAAVLVIGVLAGWNLVLQNDLGAAQRYEQNVAAVLAAAGQPGSLTAVLTADGGTGSGLAAVSPAGDMAMALRDLVPTTGTAVYEAWVIGSDGVPVPLGGFTVDSSRTAYFESRGLPAANGIVLALTLEPAPGATTPTLPIISKGVAVAPG